MPLLALALTRWGAGQGQIDYTKVPELQEAHEKRVEDGIAKPVAYKSH